MQIQKCTPADYAILAGFSKQLREDEKNDHCPDIAQANDQIRQLLQSGCDAYFFTQNEQLLGYALVRNTDEPPYLEDFFICREHRRKGYGREAFYLLYECLHTDALDLDVLAWNETGRAFWQSVGCQPRLIRMRYERNKD